MPRIESKEQPMKIGFIGTGAIASAMVKALAGQGHELFVSQRSEAVSAALCETYPEVQRACNEEIANSADVVFLCLMASVARAVLPTLDFKPGQALVSVMVDVDLAALSSFAPEAGSIDITIPLPQIETGGCPLPCYPSARLVGRLFGPDNPAFAVKDARALNAHFAASALMSTTLDQVATGAAWLANFTGDRQAAELYIGKMLGGALNSLGTQVTITQMLEELSTEGGLNATLKAHLRDHRTPEALATGLDVLKQRLGL